MTSPFIRPEKIWPPLDKGADALIDAIRLARGLAQVISEPRRRLGKKRLIAALNCVIVLLEQVNFKLGDIWEALGRPTPAEDLSGNYIYKLDPKKFVKR
jgi:hypothetical protein